MTERQVSTVVSLVGSAARVAPRFANALDIEVHAVMDAALAQAGIALADVDTVVSIGSDVVDAILVPMRSELFGGAGRASINVPSGTGAALGAAVAMIESGQAQNVLVTGWHEGGKDAARDALPLQGDPFHARRVGADPETLAALQGQWLVDGGRVPHDAVAPTRWCDGAASLVLRAGVHEGAPVVVDFASSWKPYTPALPEELDPAGWVTSALDGLARAGAWRSEAASRLVVAAASAASPHNARRALDVFARLCGLGERDARRVCNHDGASPWFGPPTGLHAIARAHRALAESRIDGALAAVLDLVGPIGQATTAILLRQERRAS